MKPRPPHPTADWTVETLLKSRADAVHVITGHGMACIGCAMARFETLAEVAREYRLDLPAFLDELSLGRVRRMRTRRNKQRTDRGHSGLRSDDTSGATKAAP